MAKFIVHRRHLGDRLYEPGEEREASASDVAHLVERGILEPVREKREAPEAKADRAPRNKAMAAPENKAQ